MIQSNLVPAEQARESKLSPSSVGSCTLQPSSSSFRTALTSPSRQASARLRAPGLEDQRNNSSKNPCTVKISLVETTVHSHTSFNKKIAGLKLNGSLLAKADYVDRNHLKLKYVMNLSIFFFNSKPIMWTGTT